MLSGDRLLSFRVTLERLIECLTSQVHEPFAFAKQVNLTLLQNSSFFEKKNLHLSV